MEVEDLIRVVSMHKICCSFLALLGFLFSIFIDLNSAFAGETEAASEAAYREWNAWWEKPKKKSGFEMQLSVGPGFQISADEPAYGLNVAISLGYSWSNTIGVFFEVDIVNWWDGSNDGDNHDCIPYPTINAKYFVNFKHVDLMLQFGLGTLVIIPVIMKIGVGVTYRFNETFSLGGSLAYLLFLGNAMCGGAHDNGPCGSPVGSGPLLPSLFMRIQI